MCRAHNITGRNIHLHELPIVSFNINGIFKKVGNFRYSKLNDDFVNYIFASNKIVGLIETHHLDSEIGDLHVEGFTLFNNCRPKKARAGKHWGGVAVYVHKSVRPGVHRIPRPGSETIWVKLDKNFFGLRKDVYTCFAYAAHANSAFLSNNQLDIFDELGNQLSEYPCWFNVNLNL